MSFLTLRFNCLWGGKAGIAIGVGLGLNLLQDRLRKYIYICIYSVEIDPHKSNEYAYDAVSGLLCSYTQSVRLPDPTDTHI